MQILIENKNMTERHKDIEVRILLNEAGHRKEFEIL